MSDDQLYDKVKMDNPRLYAEICAFASTFGKGDYTEHIDLATRAQVEKFCMSLVVEPVAP